MTLTDRVPTLCLVGAPASFTATAVGRVLVDIARQRNWVVGVLQFSNRLDPTCSEPVPFGEEMVGLLKAIASQAAVFIQKNLLIRDANELIESFVQASVQAIEQWHPP